MSNNSVNLFGSKYYYGCDHPQAECYKNSGSNNFFVCYDKPLNNNEFTKSFSSYPNIDDFLKEYEKIKDEDKMFYEQIRFKRAEFYDIDGCYTDPEFKDIPIDTYIRRFIFARLDFLKNSKWNLRNAINHFYYIKDSCNISQNKVSVHIIIRSYDSEGKYYSFGDVDEMKRYMKAFSEFLTINKDVRGGRYNCKFDDMIYTKNRNFRMLYSHKFGNTRTLQRSTYNYESKYGDIKMFFPSYVTEDYTNDIIEEEVIITAKKSKKIEYTDFEVDLNKIQTFLENCIYIKGNFDIKYESPYWLLKRLNSSDCPICSRTHDTIDQFVISFGKKVYLKCFRNNEGRFLLGMLN